MKRAPVVDIVLPTRDALALPSHPPCRVHKMIGIKRLLSTLFALSSEPLCTAANTTLQGNLDERCTDALVWELMLQAGPVGTQVLLWPAEAAY